MNNETMEEIAVKLNPKRLTPVRSIKFYCKEMCCAGDTISWMNCEFKACFLHRYRLGKRDSNAYKKMRDSLLYSSKNKVLEADQQSQ